MSDLKRSIVVSLSLLLGLSVRASVRFATPFADGMVLQRERPVPVWGSADAGAAVEVRFADQVKKTVADSNGCWKVTLDPMPASKDGRDMVAGEAKISNVLVGEVWIVSGQSNCELPLVGESPHFGDRQGLLVANMTRQPNIRFAYASTYSWSRAERKELRQRAVWKPFLPKHLREGRNFSAMGVYFALDLYAALDIPVGLVGVYWGGTAIEPWIPREAFANLAGFEWCWDWQYVADKDWKGLGDKHRLPWPNSQPSALWNDMVAPWAPMAVRGILWYQGCSNSKKSGKDDGDDYRRLMHALYDSWSMRFANPDLKLYFVQLAPFSNWWDIQLAQARFAAEEKNAAMVTTCDIGNLHDIHPNEKGTVGKRLAALALSRDYGFTDLVAEPPTVRTCESEGDRVILAFDRAERWFLYNADWSVDVPFEIAGADGVWHKAVLVNKNTGLTNTVPWKTKGRIDGRDLVLRADGVGEPKRIRYLHERPWSGFLYADSGLPLGPFEREVRPKGALRVGSYNIRYSEPKDTESGNGWEMRRMDLAALLGKLELDVVGFQEVLPSQLADLRRMMDGWTFVGDHRGADRMSDEASPVAFRDTRLNLIDSGTFWLSETPDVPGVRGWGAQCPRVCTWTILEDRDNGRRFCFANTHTDHVSEKARDEGLRLVIRRMREFGRGLPIIFVGDHNNQENEAPALGVARLLDNALYKTETPPVGPWRTWNGWRELTNEVSCVEALGFPLEVRNVRWWDAAPSKEGAAFRRRSAGPRIDYIWVSRDIRVCDYETHAERRPGCTHYPSDHFPVTATVVIGGEPPARRLVWSDEFNGTTLDPSKWSCELGFIRNREYQYYTNLMANVRVENGKLILQGHRVDFENPDYDPLATNDWKRLRRRIRMTSGSVNTHGKFVFSRGRLECSAKVPAKRGSWPAIWTLGENIGDVGWPKCDGWHRRCLALVREHYPVLQQRKNEVDSLCEKLLAVRPVTYRLSVSPCRKEKERIAF